MVSAIARKTLTGDICFHSIDSPSVPVQTIYTVDLTTDSSTYTREGIRPNYYYEAIEVNVFEDGPYIFSSDSMMNAYGYLYEHNFDPFNPPLNLVSNGAAIGMDCYGLFGLTYYFEKQKKYIWVITTFFPNTIGSLEILILGLNNITMKRIGKYSDRVHSAQRRKICSTNFQIQRRLSLRLLFAFYRKSISSYTSNVCIKSHNRICTLLSRLHSTKLLF